MIEGHLGIDFEHFLQSQAENGGFDQIKDNVNNTIISAGDTFEALTEMINVITDILKDAQTVIQDSVNNINLTSKNLADSSLEVKKSLEKGYLDKSLYNLEQTSNNLVLTTKNTNGFTDGLNKQSSVLINCLLKNLNTVVYNILTLLLRFFIHIFFQSRFIRKSKSR